MQWSIRCCAAPQNKTKQNSIRWASATALIGKTDSCCDYTVSRPQWATVSFVEASGLAERKPGPIELEGSKKGGDSSEREHVLEWAEASAKMRLDVSLSAEPLSARCCAKLAAGHSLARFGSAVPQQCCRVSLFVCLVRWYALRAAAVSYRSIACNGVGACALTEAPA